MMKAIVAVGTILFALSALTIPEAQAVAIEVHVNGKIINGTDTVCLDKDSSGTPYDYVNIAISAKDSTKGCPRVEAVNDASGDTLRMRNVNITWKANPVTNIPIEFYGQHGLAPTSPPLVGYQHTESGTQTTGASATLTAGYQYPAITMADDSMYNWLPSDSPTLSLWSYTSPPPSTGVSIDPNNDARYLVGSMLVTLNTSTDNFRVTAFSIVNSPVGEGGGKGDEAGKNGKNKGQNKDGGKKQDDGKKGGGKGKPPKP